MPTAEQLLRALEFPEPILHAIGRVAVGHMKENFRRQGLGSSFPWPARYPSQKAPKFNLAGAVEDLSTGGTVKGRRFQDRPAGIDTGALRDSITYEIDGDEAVVIGVSPALAERADRVQFGGTSVQALDRSVKEKLARFARSSRGKPVADKIEPLLQRDELSTELVPRPFIGWDPELVHLINETIDDMVSQL